MSDNNYQSTSFPNTDNSYYQTNSEIDYDNHNQYTHLVKRTHSPLTQGSTDEPYKYFQIRDDVWKTVNETNGRKKRRVTVDIDDDDDDIFDDRNTNVTDPSFNLASQSQPTTMSPLLLIPQTQHHVTQHDVTQHDVMQHNTTQSNTTYYTNHLFANHLLANHNSNIVVMLNNSSIYGFLTDSNIETQREIIR